MAARALLAQRADERRGRADARALQRRCRQLGAGGRRERGGGEHGADGGEEEAARHGGPRLPMPRRGEPTALERVRASGRRTPGSADATSVARSPPRGPQMVPAPRGYVRGYGREGTARRAAPPGGRCAECGGSRCHKAVTNSENPLLWWPPRDARSPRPPRPIRRPATRRFTMPAFDHHDDDRAPDARPPATGDDAR